MNKVLILLLWPFMLAAQSQTAPTTNTNPYMGFQNNRTPKNVPVSTLPAVDSLAPTDFFPIVHAGHYYKAYIAQLPHPVSAPAAPSIAPLAQPTGQVLFGTGAGVTSNSGLIYSTSGGLLGQYKTSGAILGLGNLTGFTGYDSAFVAYAANNASLISNNTIDLQGNYITINGNSTTRNTVTGNAQIQRNVLYDGANLTGNVLSGYSHIVNGFLLEGSSTVNGNILTADTGTGGYAPGIHGYELFNDCHIDSNLMSASGSIESIHSLASSSVNDNQLLGSKQFVSIGDIIQSQEDQINHNVLKGSYSVIENIHQMGNSNMNYDTLTGDNSSIQNIIQRNSGLSNCRIDSPNYSFQNIELKESNILNADNINITGLNLQGVNLNLNGFNRNISNESIINGSGYLGQAVNMTGLLTTDSIVTYINLIPPGYSITRIIATAGAIPTGATIMMGLEADDSSLINMVADSLVTGNLTWTGVSKSATANRSFYIQIKSTSVLADMYIYVEFIQLNTNTDFLVYKH